MSMAQLFANPAQLPVVPAVVQQLIASFSDDDVSVDSIARQLAADPVLSAKTLRLANSAYFHVSRTVATIDDALRMLGFVMVRNLVVGCGIGAAFKSVPGLDLPLFWRYSLATACAARWMARLQAHNEDQAFTAGLIHGLGHLLMHVVPSPGLQALDRDVPPLEWDRAAVELARLGYHHGEVSAELAQRWNFPSDLSTPLRWIPQPKHPDAPQPLSAQIHIASWCARAALLGWSAQQAHTCFPHDVARSLSLNWSTDLATLVATQTWQHDEVMPPMSELTQGLDSLFAA